MARNVTKRSYANTLKGIVFNPPWVVSRDGRMPAIGQINQQRIR